METEKIEKASEWGRGACVVCLCVCERVCEREME